MKNKKGFIFPLIILAVIALAFGGYNIYRHPDMFLNLSDNSLSESETNGLREEILAESDPDILVAYFSYSGTTQNIANTLSTRTGADLFEIAPQNEYDSVYRESNSEVRNNERPALAGTVEDMAQYEIVFVGYPVWWHATPALINTFLESYELEGKLIVPFCTSGGSDIDETMPTFLHSCDGLAVLQERRISSANEIDDWLAEIGLAAEASIVQNSLQN